jgi:MFS transporter, OFA family, oxalate/formate antiporter
MPSPPAASPTRWVQLLLGLVVMMAISSPQYVWTLFVKPFQAATGAGLPTVQITFSVLIVLQTVFSPAQGWLVDRFGPKALVAVGAALTGLGWVLSAHVDNIWMLFRTYGLFCGVGTGIVYVGVIGLMARWFPDRRGFAIGIVAAGYGMGAMLTTFPISSMLASSGAPTTLVVFGVILGAIGVLAALGLREPRAGEAPARLGTRARGKDVAPVNMLKTPIFWLMFVMMTMMSTGGLMVTSNFANFARDFGVADVLVLGLAALPFALTVDRLLNGLTRPFFGWVSDRIGRENTMGIAFGLEAAAILLLLAFRQEAPAFIALSGLVFFGWGEIFSLFPSTLTDTFGSRYATTNYGFLYMAQGVGSILGGPVAAAMRVSTGSWTPVFGVAVAMDVATALLALFALKRMRAAYLGGQASSPSAELAPATSRGRATVPFGGR